MIEPVPRIGAGDCLRPRTVPSLQLPLADRLDHERRTADLFERVLRAEQLALAKASEPGEKKAFWPYVFIFVDRPDPDSPAREWQLWPAHPAFADEIRRWWPSDEYPPKTPDVVIEDQRPDHLPDVVLMPARGGLFDIWI